MLALWGRTAHRSPQRLPITSNTTKDLEHCLLSRMRFLLKYLVHRFRQRRRRFNPPAPTPSSSFCSPGSLGKLSTSGSDRCYDPTSRSIHVPGPSKVTSDKVYLAQTGKHIAVPVSANALRNQGSDPGNISKSPSVIPALKFFSASGSSPTIVPELPRTTKLALGHSRDLEQLRIQVRRLQDELQSLTKNNHQLKQENEILQSILQELGLSSDKKSLRFLQDSIISPRSLDVYEAQLALTLKARREARRNSNVAHFWKKLAKVDSHNLNVVTPSASALSETSESLGEERAIRLQELIKRRREIAVYQKATREIASNLDTDNDRSGSLDSTLASSLTSNELRDIRSLPYLVDNSMTSTRLSSERSTVLNSLQDTASSFTLRKTYGFENPKVELEESSTLLPYVAVPASLLSESTSFVELPRLLVPTLNVFLGTPDDQPCMSFLTHSPYKNLSATQTEMSSTTAQLMPVISTTSTYRSITLAYLSSTSSMPTLVSSDEKIPADVDFFDVASEARLLPTSSSLPSIPSFRFTSSTSDYSWAAQTARSTETISECPTSTSSSSLTSSSSSSSSVSIPLSILALAFPLPPTTLPQHSLSKPSSAIASPDVHAFIPQIELIDNEPSTTEELGDTVSYGESKMTLDVKALLTMKSDLPGMLPVSNSPPSSPSSPIQESVPKDKSSMRRSYPFLIPRSNLLESDVEPLLLPLLSEFVNDSSFCLP